MTSVRRGVLQPDPALDSFRVVRGEKCWWCGELATTEEHRIKASTLRRVGRDERGAVDARNVFKKSSDYEGALRTLRKGPQVRWNKNLCARCNNSKSQPFDRAYDAFEEFLVGHFIEIAIEGRIDWAQIYGGDWELEAINLGRYFGKQLGCMLSTYSLPIPPGLQEFLDGVAEIPATQFSMYINADVVGEMVQHPEVDWSTLVGLGEAPAYETAGRFSGTDYSFYVGYLNFLVEWREEEVFDSWWKWDVVELPRYSSKVQDVDE